MISFQFIKKTLCRIITIKVGRISGVKLFVLMNVNLIGVVTKFGDLHRLPSKGVDNATN